MRQIWSTEFKIIAGFSLALSLLVIVAGVSAWQTAGLLDDLNAVSQHNRVLQAVREFRNSLGQTASAARLYAIDHQEKNLQEWEKLRAEMDEKFEALDRATYIKPQQDRVDTIRRAMAEKTRQTTRDTRPEDLLRLWGSDGFVEIRELLVLLDTHEQNFLDERNQTGRERAQQARYLIGGSSVLAVVLVVGAAWTVLRDLQARRRAAEELERARLAAEAASVAKSAFLANMSHELRTPLTAIMGYADLLMSSDPAISHSHQSTRRDEYLTTMRRSGEHLLTLINDILDVSKIEAGRMDIESVECRTANVLAEVESLMRSRAIQKKISFDIRYETPVPQVILTDPTRFRQILVNLVGNAIKFTDHGSVGVRVTYTPDPERPSDDPRGQLSLAVVDTGVGIPREQQQLLFQPFSQADVSMTRRFGGTGLGLSISRRLAQMMGGNITLQSELGRGSTFTFSIPAAPVGDERIPPGEARLGLRDQLADLPVHGRRLGIRVLLAEDGDDNREVLTLHLTYAGCIVTGAGDGSEAYRLVTEAARRGQPFDVILMDMQMPVMDGYTATSKLRADGYQGAIIALTAHAMAEDRDRCLRVGCDEYATKPVDMPMLLGLMERLCGRAGNVSVTTRMMANPALRALTAKFCTGIDKTLHDLRSAVEHGQHEILATLAHKFAGSAGAYGFIPAAEAAKALEQAARRHAERPELEPLLTLLQQHANEARTHVLGPENQHSLEMNPPSAPLTEWPVAGKKEP